MLDGMRGFAIGEYILGSCLGGGGKHETWRAHSRSTQQPLAMKLRRLRPPSSDNPTAEEMALQRMTTEELRAITHRLCTKVRLLKWHYPGQFVDCIDNGVLQSDHERLAWAVMDLAPGRTLRSILVDSPEEPPAEIGNLSSVLGLSLRLFEVMNQGLQPVGGRGFRYLFSDVQWGNVMLDAHGGLTLVDYDDDEVVACYAREPANGADGLREDALPLCASFTEAFLSARYVEMFRDLLLNILLMLIRIDATSHRAFSRSADPGNGIQFIPQAVLRYFHNLDVAHARCWTQNSSHGTLVDVDGEAAAESLRAHMRPAFTRDWLRVHALAGHLFASVAEAVETVKWPPSFMGHLRAAHDLLS